MKARGDTTKSGFCLAEKDQQSTSCLGSHGSSIIVGGSVGDNVGDIVGLNVGLRVGLSEGLRVLQCRCIFSRQRIRENSNSIFFSELSSETHGIGVGIGVTIVGDNVL